jgi:hypothetical protein
MFSRVALFQDDTECYCCVIQCLMCCIWLTHGPRCTCCVAPGAKYVVCVDNTAPGAVVVWPPVPSMLYVMLTRPPVPLCGPRCQLCCVWAVAVYLQCLSYFYILCSLCIILCLFSYLSHFSCRLVFVWKTVPGVIVLSRCVVIVLVVYTHRCCCFVISGVNCLVCVWNVPWNHCCVVRGVCVVCVFDARYLVPLCVN